MTATLWETMPSVASMNAELRNGKWWSACMMEC